MSLHHPAFSITILPIFQYGSAMKTTLDLTDTLLEQAKATARAQGTSLKQLFETGLQMALNAKKEPQPMALWPDLTFKPRNCGHLVEPSQWRELANERESGITAQ
jgi:elongation factor P--beta-lysine ligase